jgi:hypothetical protein
MTAPQITMIILISTSLLLESHLHGKPKTKNYNFWSALFSSSILLSILYWGNFFN